MKWPTEALLGPGASGTLRTNYAAAGGLVTAIGAVMPPSWDLVPPQGVLSSESCASELDELCVVGDADAAAGAKLGVSWTLVPLPRAFLCRRAKSGVKTWTLRTNYSAVAALKGEIERAAA